MLDYDAAAGVGQGDTGDKVKRVIQRREAMRSFRMTFDSHYQEIAERVWPSMANFNTIVTPGQKRTQKMFDGTAALAAQRYQAIIESMVVPRSQIWHYLRPMVMTNVDLSEDRDTMLWMEAQNKKLFAYRYGPRANFSSQKSESFMSLGVFGSGIVYIGKGSVRKGTPLYYKSVPLSEIYLDEGENGRIEEAMRVIKKKLRLIAEEFGTDGWSDNLKECLTKDGDKEFTVLHWVFPNTQYAPMRLDRHGKRFSSIYVLEEEKVVLAEGGYSTFPYAVCRGSTAANEVYGRSPAMLALPNIKMLGEMIKTTVKNAQRMADPSLLLYEDGALTEVNTLPGGLNFGGLDAQGNQLVKPLQTGADMSVAQNMIQEERRFINDVFLVTLFQILVENPQMTATEVLEKAQEKGALLSPTMGRIQEEDLGTQIEREMSILGEFGLLDPLPEALAATGGSYTVQHDSPLTRAQSAEEVTGIVRTFQTIAPLAQVNPSVFDNFDSDEIVRIAAKVNGAPVKALLAREDVDRIRQARAEQQQQQEAMAAQANMASALKDVASAEKDQRSV